MNQLFTLVDPTETAIAFAHRTYVPDLCSSARQIVELFHAMGHAGYVLVGACKELKADAYLEAYLHHASAYEQIMRHPKFESFESDVRIAWLRTPATCPFLSGLSRTAILPNLMNMMLDWRQEHGASASQMLESLVIQKIALVLGVASPGEEVHFIEEDYEATGPYMKRGLKSACIARLESHYCQGNGSLFA